MNPNDEVSLPVECRTWLDALDAGAAMPEHPAVCAGCAKEAEVRMNMANRVRVAHESVTLPPGLETRIRAAIRAGERQPRAWRGASLWMTAAAALIMTLSLGVAYQLGHLRWTQAAQDSYLAAMSNRVASILRVGLRDHIHCGVYGKYAKTPSREQFVADLGPEYKDLLDVVGRQAPAGYQIVAGHKCSYQGRKFAHLVMKGDGRMLSLVVARKEDGESFTTEQLLPAFSQSHTHFFQAQAQRFAISAFETDRHLVYTVSDLTAEQNMKIMVAMAPQVREVLARAL